MRDDEPLSPEDLNHLGELTPDEMRVRQAMWQQVKTLWIADTPEVDLVLYYPGSGLDKSFARAFPTSRAIYADSYPVIADMLRQQLASQYPEHRATVHCADAEDISPGPIDVLCIVGTLGIDAHRQSRNVKPGGCVICSNNDGAYFDTLNADPEFRFVGVVQGNETQADAPRFIQRVRSAIGEVLTEAPDGLDAFSRSAVTDEELGRTTPLMMSDEQAFPGTTFGQLWTRDRRRYLTEIRKHIPDLNPKTQSAGGDVFYVFQRNAHNE